MIRHLHTLCYVIKKRSLQQAQLSCKQTTLSFFSRPHRLSAPRAHFIKSIFQLIVQSTIQHELGSFFPPIDIPSIYLPLSYIWTEASQARADGARSAVDSDVHCGVLCEEEWLADLYVTQLLFAKLQCGKKFREFQFWRLL